MYISAIICTHNRSRHLEAAVASLINQTLPRDGYEIIVVDNASADDTGQVVRGLSSGTLNVRHVYEPELGLSHARNRGVAEARGDVVAFMDDDAVADPQWLSAIKATFEGVSPQPVCVGGKVSPIWESPRPDWLPDDSKLGILTVLHWGEQPLWLQWGRQYLVGTNIAFKKDRLLAVGGFNPTLGRKGEGLLADEESLVLSLIYYGFGEKSIYYQPEAHVRHLIPDLRVSKRYLFKRCYSHAASGFLRQEIVYRMLSASNRHLLKDSLLWEVNKPRFIVNHVKIVLSIMKDSVYAVLTRSKPRRTEYLFHIAFKLGHFVESSKYVLGLSGPLK
jgi:glycosyltransferase involved in cell wall biosynthesis